MLIDGRYYSETELISLFKKMQKQIAELTSECVRLKNVVSMNSESQKIADGVIEELKQENAEMKTMLKQAIKDFESLIQKFDCVENEKFGCDTCEYGCPEYCQQWRYKEQALKLIGE